MKEVRDMMSIPRTRTKFSEIEDVFGPVSVITSFSHLNPNLPIDEVNGNLVVAEMMEKADLDKGAIMNIAYDNAVAEKDKPPGCKLQFGPVNPDVLLSNLPYSTQREILEVPFDQIYSRILPAFGRDSKKTAESRMESLISLLKRDLSCRSSDAVPSLIGLRRDLLHLISPNTGFVPENYFSGAMTEKTIRVLEALDSYGFPFWDMPLGKEWEKVKGDITYLLRGINKKGEICPVRFDGKLFSFSYSKEEVKEVSKDDVYYSLHHGELIPTVPVIVLGLVTAPGIVHIGGAQWRKYAPSLIESQAKWLGISEYQHLAVTTGGYEHCAVKNRSGALLKGIFANYLHCGNSLATVSKETKIVNFGTVIGSI